MFLLAIFDLLTFDNALRLFRPLKVKTAFRFIHLSFNLSKDFCAEKQIEQLRAQLI